MVLMIYSAGVRAFLKLHHLLNKAKTKPIFYGGS